MRAMKKDASSVDVTSTTTTTTTTTNVDATTADVNLIRSVAECGSSSVGGNGPRCLRP